MVTFDYKWFQYALKFQDDKKNDLIIISGFEHYYVKVITSSSDMYYQIKIKDLQRQELKHLSCLLFVHLKT